MMLFLKFIYLFNLLIIFQIAATKNFIKIKINSFEHTNNTVVFGLRAQNWLGGDYYGFQGIRYAKPPIDELRFKDPQSQPLPAIIDARYMGNDCHSIYATNASEDCLNLNVYTPKLQSSEKLQPVLVFIHPGGLYVGSALKSFISPDYLLAKSLVLVTFNYRLGTLGYLNLGTPSLPGNAGFKDQVLALKWVQQHIHNFGGNATDVTLMGYSAGALSVSQHLTSPMSVGLFHKVIIMSGALPPQMGNPLYHQRDLAMRQAKLLNCNLNFSQELPNFDVELLKCLNAHTGVEIAATLRGMFDFGKDNPMFLWLPLIEQDFGQQRFLLENFYDAMAAQRFHKVPILIGYTDGEFCTSVAEMLRDANLTQKFYTEFEQLAPKIFMYQGHEQSAHITAKLRQHYMGNDTLFNFTRLCDLFSDALTRAGAERLARLAANAHVPVYSYKFAYRGEFSNLIYAENWGKARADHMDDLMYLFGMTPHYFHPTDKDANIVELYVNFFYDFIQNGNFMATLDGNTARGYPTDFILITHKIELVHGRNFAEAAFWEQLFS